MYSNQITGAQWMLNVSNSASNIVNDINQALVWTTKWNAMTRSYRPADFSVASNYGGGLDGSRPDSV